MFGYLQLLDNNWHCFILVIYQPCSPLIMARASPLNSCFPPTFGTFFIQVDALFETIRYCGFEWWNNCAQCWFPKWFWMVGQLIQNLVWILPNGSTANTKPCLDTSKWWINGPSKTIWMVVRLATNTVQMVSPCVYKTNGHFWKWKFGMVSNGPSVGGLI